MHPVTIRRAARASGVTLIELLVVLTLMAILAAIAVPMLGPGVSNAELKSAARKVAAGLRMARDDAVATRTDTRLVLDLEHRTFQIERDAHVHALPRELEMKLFTAQNDIVERARRCDPLLSRRRVDRRPRHAGGRRAQVRSRRRLAYRSCRDTD